jgi:TRAP-type mannitol/chloroaromatic compound transport system permease small subunit
LRRAGASRWSAGARLDYLLTRLTESLAALLVALEVVVLFAGVVSRYVFHSPLTWSDELASILFLWLAMLGAVIALHKSEHMRLTAVVSRVPASWRRTLETIAALVIVVFVLLIIEPAWRYGEQEQLEGIGVGSGHGADGGDRRCPARYPFKLVGDRRGAGRDPLRRSDSLVGSSDVVRHR